MAKYRQGRINDAVASECAVILREIKDPGVSGVMLTVVGADVTADLKYAKVFVSYMGEADEKELKKALRRVSPFVRSQLAGRLNLRATPEISFVLDDSIRHGSDIAAILKALEDGQNGE